MDRRTFFSGTVAASVATLANIRDTPTATAGQFTGKIRKAVKFHMATGTASVLQKFKLIRDLGFDGVETRVALGRENRPLVASYAEASSDSGLPIHGVIHSSNPDLAGAIDQAKMLGAGSVLHVVRYDSSMGYMENYNQTQEVIRKALDRAHQQNVMILLENVWATFLIEPLTMARYIDELDSPMVGAYFDVGNVVRWGWPQHWIEVLGQRIKKLDIKEYDLGIAMNEGMRSGFGKPLGEGSIDWEKVRAELMSIGYQGWATAEVKGGDRQRLSDIASQMDRVLDL